MTWSLILSILFAELAKNLPLILQSLVAWLKEVLPKPPSGNMAVESPSELKEAVKSWLSKSLAKIKRPVLHKFLQLLVSMVSDDLIDNVWDELFHRQVVTQRAATFTKVHEPSRFTGVLAASFADVEVELAKELHPG